MTKELDTPPAGWFPLSVMKTGEGRKWDWVCLMIDIDPDDYRRGRNCTAPSVWVRIPGKHRNREDAEAALQDMLETRH